jgi:alpha-1,3/alpha-1,6-mannosyltransferase
MPLSVAFLHPDLGIGEPFKWNAPYTPDSVAGGAERLVVDAALGLQNLGHSVDLYTSHHDANHCFEETRNGTALCSCLTPNHVSVPRYPGNLSVHHIQSPFPNAWRGKFHILFAHARQLHLTQYLLRSSSPRYDVYFVDQLSTCIPFLRAIANRRVVFYCHFPDKLLADGEYVEGRSTRQNAGFLKRLYRWPMDWIEEATTSMLLAHHINGWLFTLSQDRPISSLRIPNLQPVSSNLIYPQSIGLQG